ncbi:MAG: hypothetical protein EZS28_022411 [Streblomastix strix]|uniref:Uncharacterized protein n=1 Tax=Streblomastix strix TaxID=222440 RepID=A0A5J4VHK5_9EUKA|nr:MAG: hypothetical protein EZS28_022411 [Streblomastix strix]
MASEEECIEMMIQSNVIIILKKLLSEFVNGEYEVNIRDNQQKTNRNTEQSQIIKKDYDVDIRTDKIEDNQNLDYSSYSSTIHSKKGEQLHQYKIDENNIRLVCLILGNIIMANARFAQYAIEQDIAPLVAALLCDEVQYHFDNVSSEDQESFGQKIVHSIIDLGWISYHKNNLELLLAVIETIESLITAARVSRIERSQLRQSHIEKDPSETIQSTNHKTNNVGVGLTNISLIDNDDLQITEWMEEVNLMGLLVEAQFVANKNVSQRAIDILQTLDDKDGVKINLRFQIHFLTVVERIQLSVMASNIPIEQLQILNEISALLNTGLSSQALIAIVNLLSEGYSPEAVIDMIKYLRIEEQEARKGQ